MNTQVASHYTCKRYGITTEQYLERLEAQDFKCAICKRESDKHLVIDHNHNCCDLTVQRKACGKCVRGLLCHRCNVGIGSFKDDAHNLQNAVDYLRGAA